MTIRPIMVGRRAKPLENPPNRIREVRERLGITQDAIGKAISVSGEQVRKLENGTNEVTIGRLEQIARFLHVKPHTLLRDYEPITDGQERHAVELLRKLSPDDRDRAIKMLGALAPQEQPQRRHAS